MDKNDFSYCGLNCATCKERFAEVRKKAGELDAVFEKVNIAEMARIIPFMNSKFKGYKKLLAFFNHECPGCRKKGGNPFCGIRKCSKRKGYVTCVECGSDICGKYKPILKVHRDNEIQNNRAIIKQMK
jgi:hypothetical protein